MLVFPSEVKTDIPDYPGEYVREVIFHFEGPVSAIYATLVVSLIHSPTFTKDKLYHNAAVFYAMRQQHCGFVMDYPERSSDALGRLTVFFEAHVETVVKLSFLRFVNRHLEKSALLGSIKRERVYQCPGCGYVIPTEAVRLRKERGETTIGCNICERYFVQIDDLAEESAQYDKRVEAIQAEAQEEQELQTRRAVFEAKERRGVYHVFLCHNHEDKAGVRRLAAKLREQGIVVWIDEEEDPARRAIHRRDGEDHQ